MSRQFGNRTSVRCMQTPNIFVVIKRDGLKINIPFVLFRNYQNLHNRSALLGDARTDDGRTPSPFGYDEQQQQQSVRVNMNDRDLDYLESQNDDEITGLSAKVKILKSVSWYRALFHSIVAYLKSLQ